jgi:hypothetical protein
MRSGSVEETVQCLQEARARELEAIGATRAAERVRRCGAMPGYLSRRTCKERLCPRCARTKADAVAARLLDAVASMEERTLVLLTVGFRPAGHLASALDELRVGLRRWCRALATSAAGAIEPRLAHGELGWAVHAHLIVDAGRDVAEHHLERWGTHHRRGVAEVSGSVAPFEVGRVARYVAKPDDWCPPPGHLDTARLAELRNATRSRRHLLLHRLGAS